MTRTVLRGGRVFDGTGSDPAPADVAIEDGRIVGLGSGLDGDVEIDVRDRTILPGMFDCHVHVMSIGPDPLEGITSPFSYQFYAAGRNLLATLRTGVTSVRDAGGADLGVKVALEEGLIPGPRMQISISMLSQTGGHGDDWYPGGAVIPFGLPHPGRPDGIADGPDEVRRKVRELARNGADVIKIAASGGVMSPRSNPRLAHYRPEELAVIVEEATAADIPVMAHVQSAEGILNAVKAGVRSVEHGIFLDDEGIELMRARGTWLVPTLVAPQGVIDAAADGVAIPPNVLEKAHAVIDSHRAGFRKAVESGVRIAMGTDSGVVTHGRNLRELALMVEGGMTPAAALEATTRSAAQLLRVDDQLGTIEAGKVADLVIVSGDPYDFVSLGERVEEVWQSGARVL